MVLVGIAIVSFLLAAILGWVFQGAKFWSFVDLVYYPLGCVGVVLFFFLAASEREEILILESLAETEAEIQSVQGPLSEVQTDRQILKSTRSFLYTVREMAEVHRLYPTGPEKFAPAAAVDPYLKSFLNKTEKLVADDSSTSLSKQSEAAQTFLQQIHDEGALSRTITFEMVEHYADGLQEGWSDIVENLDAANTHVLKFDERVDQKVKAMQTSWTFKEKEGFVPLLEYEKETAELLLHGLKPYLCVAVGKTDAFLDWQAQQNSTEESKAELQERILDPQIAAKGNVNLKKTQLLIWPYVLVMALSLKFAKGVAGLRLVFLKNASEENTDAHYANTVD